MEKALSGISSTRRHQNVGRTVCRNVVGGYGSGSSIAACLENGITNYSAVGIVLEPGGSRIIAKRR